MDKNYQTYRNNYKNRHIRAHQESLKYKIIIRFQILTIK